MFDQLGWGEIAVLLLLALFIFGPERLPGIAAEAGRGLRKLRGMLKGVTDDLKAELGPEVGDLDLRSLHPREIVRKALMDDDDAVPAPPTAVMLAPDEPAPWDPDAT